MASIGTITPTPQTNQTAATATSGSSSTTGSAADPLANESTFLTLLVSQLKNQNPASPMDGTTFVTQLAQFSDLEQNLAMRQDLDSINAKYTGNQTAPASSTTADGNNATQGSDKSAS
jgi:flagellar basal-body rod modification protein FlgD